ncbi:uncharacterized protein MYCFIDRAFT_27819 [Pseudocercospora fijiensis CIRAD86]|uniref:SET domain-containing protein n=1 Tax=Pseudocercospora fijiensis (strain CIRAD86) TaxID=383855 RepID=N1Q9T7_PSEFD|nr:uncharacterized protein MYCFIDRAFT_27819 [Pseudocercospora fijiensis CIRAD86]EME87638.1 hypothetical protein MYCFIDRAFT_27819 [Pseudocercospora fijiensis CIRAD86]
MLLRMCSPSSGLFEIRAIPNAGRGVIAIRDIPAGTPVLESGPAAAHIIFKEYRKETCAYCFQWDRGRTLPVREHELGKWFCSSDCQGRWKEEQGDLGIEAWSIVTAFGHRNTKRRGDDDEIMSDAVRPTEEEIAASWATASERAKLLLRGRTGAPVSKPERKQLQALRQDLAQPMDSDLLAYLLEGALLFHQRPAKWRQEVLSLAMDHTPYKTKQDLDSSCRAFLQLTSILPETILPALGAELCLALVQADNHNAFGIRGGGEDSEEYMGYGLYPCASYFNHSCDPNIAKHRRGRSWEFHALRDISAGEECCITYLGGDERDMDVLERLRRLRDVWDFVCVCQRCKAEAGI